MILTGDRTLLPSSSSASSGSHRRWCREPPGCRYNLPKEMFRGCKDHTTHRDPNMLVTHSIEYRVYGV